MRLVNVQTLQLEEFEGYRVPPYAILSHVWGQQEVSFREMTGDHSALAYRKGFQKIVGCCAKASSEGHRFVWIDTCCIDKSCSTELSEAINSMFRWYREAAICYAYLDDVPSSESPTNVASSFARSRWFSRGWTLQELLAPFEVAFLCSDWWEIGTKRSLSKIISDITNIDERTLSDCSWSHASIACRMSWASFRQTSRQEDMAYSLMGLFDVNMPLIYGEGLKAFHRLQLEIMKSSDDQSIFAWAPGDFRYRSLGLLADSPEDFRQSYGITDCPMTGGDTISYDISKQDIRLSTPILQLGEKQEINGVEKLQLNHHFKHPDSIGKSVANDFHFDSKDTWDSNVVAILRCEDDFGYIAIPLRRLNSGEYERFADNRLQWLRTRTKEWPPLQKVFVRTLRAQNVDRTYLPSSSVKSPHTLLIQTLRIEESSYYISGGYPPNFIAAPGEKPSESEAVARINKAASIVTPIILFFANERPAEYMPFALRFDRFGQHGTACYHTRCHVGSSIKGWEKGELPLSIQEDDKVVRVDADAQIHLSGNKFLCIRLRKAPPQAPVREYINISIENRPLW